jgi:beta-barrel assembly-enhancing protease
MGRKRCIVKSPTVNLVSLLSVVPKQLNIKRAIAMAATAVLLGGMSLGQAGGNASTVLTGAELWPNPATSESAPAVVGLATAAIDGAQVPDLVMDEAANLLLKGPVVSGPEANEKVQRFAKKFGSKYDISKIGDRGVGKGINLYNLEKERAIGKELSMEVEQSSRLVTDPVVTEYVNRIGQNLVRNSDAKVPFTIKVIDNDEVNAFALPGGFFYVNTGLILAADNESELAGVMAHEIAHVAARHATKNQTKAQIWNLASIPLIFVGGPVGYAIQQAAGLAVPMSFLKFSRDAEREADLLGLEYQYASGYDPGSFVQFFEKIKVKDKHKTNFLAKAFSTHPMTDDRIARAQNEIEALLPDRDQYVVDTSEFQEVKGRLSALTNRNKMQEPGNMRPTLRRRVDPDDRAGQTDNKDDKDRPTLKRRTN